MLHLLVLTLCLGLILAAFVLEPIGDGLSLVGRELPDTCSFRRVTGIPCPGCGLSRSWVAAVRGDLSRSVQHHGLGWMLLTYAMLQALRHAAWLAGARHRLRIEGLGRPLDLAILPVFALLLLRWIFVLV